MSCSAFGISPEYLFMIAGSAEGRAEWGSSPAATTAGHLLLGCAVSTVDLLRTLLELTSTWL